MSTPSAYENILARFREVWLLNTTSAALSWDQETYMPDDAASYRADQAAYLAAQAHRLMTSPEVSSWLSSCEADSSAFPSDSPAAANLREWRHDIDRATKIPTELIAELARLSSLGREAWQDARKKSDFSIFAPWLEKIVALKRRSADYWGYQGSPYNALLEGYERDARVETLTPVLNQLALTLKELLPLAQERTARVDHKKLLGVYPIEAQIKFNLAVATAMGFDFRAGRIDPTAHPFCTTLGPRDIRLTTRYDTTDFTSSLFSVMHEAGHGLYEQGLPLDAFGTPLGEAVSLGIHESQSRLWENQIGRSRLFWEHWFPIACDTFPGLKEKLSLEEFLLVINRVTPSFIRTESDEVTYNLHIILRYEIEQSLISGSLKVADLPAAWNARFKELFGLTPPDAAHGCLQDVHWSQGDLGYFATYTLGNLNAAQLYHTALGALPQFPAEANKGNYSSLLSWLRTNIHTHGRRYTPSELMRRATGESTNPTHLGEYLRSKFTPKAHPSKSA